MENEVAFEYKTSLKMLMDTIKKCPEDLWKNDIDHVNAFWSIVYHTLFYTHLHFTPETEKFIPWEKHIKYYNNFGSISPHDNMPIYIDKIYSREDISEYAGILYALFENSTAKNGDE